MNEEREKGSRASSCSAFESYWDKHGGKTQPPIMQEAMKEVAWKAWCACAGHAVLIADSWQNEAPSVMRVKLLPNAKDEASTGTN